MFGKAVSDNFNQGYENERRRQNEEDFDSHHNEKLDDADATTEDNTMEDGTSLSKFKFSGSYRTPIKRKIKHDKSKIKEKAKRQTDAGRQELATRYELLPEGSIGRNYLYLCDISRIVVWSNWFNSYIFGCILLAGALVGVDTYENMGDDPIVMSLEYTILASFTAEILLKVLAEGFFPQYFFIGNEYKWNIFDFLVVVFSFPGSGGGQVAILRLLRLARLAKLFKRVPQLNMIVQGLVGGLKSIFFILILLILTFYLYAVAGIIFFRPNDPYNFRSIEVTFVSLLLTLTFDGWGDIFYTNYYGCDTYGALHFGVYTNDPNEDMQRLGDIMYCDAPEHRPVMKAVATVYFISFIILAAYCILSMFVGAVMISMVDSMIGMQKAKWMTLKERRKKEIKRQIEYLSNPNNIDRSKKRTVRLIKLVFTGRSISMDIISKSHVSKKKIIREKAEAESWHHKLSIAMIPYYVTLVDSCGYISEHVWFNNFVTFVILVASAEVGSKTDFCIK